MSQYSGNVPQHRRKLTPEQRARILRMRRMRRLKKRLMIAAPIVVVLVVVLVVTLTSGGKREDAQREPLALPEATVQAVMTQGDGAPDATAVADASAQSDAAMGGTDVSPVVSAAPQATLPTTSGKFVYDDAYATAAMGETTGPVLAADLSSVDPMKADRWPKAKEGYIPVIYKAETQENIIAITVDDCYQGENLQRIVQCALDNNAMLTIFPIGENLSKSEVANAIKWAWESGMEIENHTYKHTGMYHFDDERLTSEMWYQNVKLSQVLGVNYQEHFFRPRGGDEREDQRVHAYAKQMGMKGIAVWTQTGSIDSMESLFNNLAPGRIYLFHTTDNDLNKLLEFIPGAVQRGYRLVTLNEMFGLPNNETSDISTIQDMPALEPFQINIPTLKKTSYLRAAAAVQTRLIELGWLEGEADGVYGQSSFMATGYFQLAAGLHPNGNADEETQKALFSDDAPRGSKERIEELRRSYKK